jgi:hypothetical protein
MRAEAVSELAYRRMWLRLRLSYLVTTAPSARTDPPVKLQTLLFAVRLHIGPGNARIEQDEHGHYLNMREPRVVMALDPRDLLMISRKGDAVMYFVHENEWPAMLGGESLPEICIDLRKGGKRSAVPLSLSSVLGR